MDFELPEANRMLHIRRPVRSASLGVARRLLAGGKI